MRRYRIRVYYTPTALRVRGTVDRRRITISDRRLTGYDECLHYFLYRYSVVLVGKVFGFRGPVKCRARAYNDRIVQQTSAVGAAAAQNRRVTS